MNGICKSLSQDSTTVQFLIKVIQHKHRQGFLDVEVLFPTCHLERMKGETVMQCAARRLMQGRVTCKIKRGT